MTVVCSSQNIYRVNTMSPVKILTAHKLNRIHSSNPRRRRERYFIKCQLNDIYAHSKLVIRHNFPTLLKPFIRVLIFDPVHLRTLITLFFHEMMRLTGFACLTKR